MTYDPASIVLKHFKGKPLAKGYLDKLKPAKVLKATSTFASLNSEEEKPLFLYDNSFLQNGSGGMLVTDRYLYGSELPKPIPLASIYAVETLSESAGTGTGGIIVNGMLVCKADKILPWWLSATEDLGNHAREQCVDWPPHGLDQAAINKASEHDYATSYISAVTSDAHDSRHTPVEAGHKDAVSEFIELNLPNFAWQGRPGYFLIQFIGGLCGLAVFLPLAILSIINKSPAMKFLAPLAIVAMAIAASGFYSWLRNRRPPSSETILARWQAHCEQIAGLLP